MNAATNKGAIKTITKHYIDGTFFVYSYGREVMDIINPTRGEAIAHVTLVDEEDARRAIAAALSAHSSAFGRTTKEERAKILRRLHEAVSARIDDLTNVMVEEYGGVVQFAAPIVQSGANAFLAAEEGTPGAAVDPKLGQDYGHLGAGRRCRPDYAVERERAVPLR